MSGQSLPWLAYFLLIIFTILEENEDDDGNNDAYSPSLESLCPSSVPFFNGPECYFFVFLSGRFFFLFIALSFSSSLLHHGSVHFDSPGCGKVNPRQRDRFRYCYQPDGHFSRTRSCLSIDTDGTFPTRSNHVKCLRKKKKV